MTERGWPILILDSRNPGRTTPPEILQNWPGPRCLIVGAGQAAPAPLPDEFLFTFVTDRPSGLATLRDVLVAAHRSPAQARGPLLFLAATAPATPRFGLIRQGLPGPGQIRWKLDRDGDLLSLAAGAEVTAHPLFHTFFANMAPDLARRFTQAGLEQMKTYLETA